MALKYKWPVAIGAGLAALLFFTRKSSAASMESSVGPSPSPSPGPSGSSSRTYTYTIQGGEDSTASGLAKAWTGSASIENRDRILQANPSLQLKSITSLTYYDTGVNGDKTGVGDEAGTGPIRVAQIQGDVPGVGLSPDSPVGENYPNNPTPGHYGRWEKDPNVMRYISPWRVGQKINIPASWGAPPAALAKFATKG